MGTKKFGREVHQKHDNEVNHLKDVTSIDEYSSIKNLGKGFISNKEQTSNVAPFNLKADSNLNNHEIGKRKHKRKSDHSDADVEIQKVREHDKVSEKDGNEQEMLEKNIREKVAKNGSSIDSAENEAREGMERAKDGKKDKKRRKKQKGEKGIGDDTEDTSKINGKAVGNGREILEENFMEKVAKNGVGVDSTENEAGKGMPRAEGGKKDEKKRKKQKRDKEILEENFVEKVAKTGVSVDSTENEAGEGMPRAEGGKKDEKKRKKRKRDRDVGDTGVISGGIDGKEARNERLLLGENVLENVEPSRKKKKKKKKQKCELGNEEMDLTAAANCSNEVEKKKKRKKVEPEKTSSEVDGFTGTEQKLGDEVTDASVRSKSKEASKRVSFSEDVEIFPSSDDSSDGESVQKRELVRGKRFSREEDEMVKDAVLNYIDQHGLGEEGLDMVLKCRKYPQVRNCWKEIGAALPWRPCESVYHRAHVLFERDDNHKWTEEEYELVQKFHEKYGPDWRTLGDALGKHRFHVKDAWRRINVANRNRGQWSQDEYQSLFDLVNMDLRMKAFEERKSKHGMLRDNICWTAISNKLGSRATPMCCMKWYDNLTSPLVAEGKWADVDDYRLLIALYDVDACCMEDVDWDSLLEHRPGDVCRKRWNQMVKHLGELQNGSFAEQVEVLIKRYCPDVLEAREAYNSKPFVD